ncbi:MAG: hypothetical protein IJX80_08080 [Clostridia bacterium]|nr:hypothetical protein [Clostridia bacterium]
MKPKKDVVIVKKKNTVVSLRLKRWHLVVAALLLVALVAGGVILGMQLVPRAGIDDDAVDYPWSPPEDDGDAGDISLPGYETITLPANETTVGIVLPNPSGNPCNFWFTLILEDTGEVLYRSGMIPPGMAVTEITLSRALAVGDYKLTIQIETASVSEGVPMNGATMQVALRVR